MGQKSTKITKQWADGPFQLFDTSRKKHGDISKRGALQAATEMALIHNIMIRILNCIYLQAPNVSEPKDIADFANFMYAWVILLHEHHSNEEKFFFPWLEEYIGIPGYMEPNVDQHHAFGPGLDKFEDYVKGLKDGTETYDSKKVISLIDSFGELLNQHLIEEPTFFESLEKFGDKIDWPAWNKRVSEVAVKTADTDYEIPVVLTNMDLTFEDNIHLDKFPPFPWFVDLMFRWVYVPRHKGAWRFSCCDDRGNPRDLQFV